MAGGTGEAAGSRRRLLVASLAALAVLVPLGWFWQASLLPDEYSVMDMGYADYGGGPHAGATGPVHAVTDLTATPDRPADVRVDLVARKQRLTLASGRTLDGYTLNGRSPGPLITVRQGQLLEVHLTNASVPDGITLHWHGVEVPNAADGVAGVTQDALAVGEEHTYRFVADEPGTYWYHSHQVSHEQVLRGLLGPLVVLPLRAGTGVLDVPALVHLYDGTRTVNGREGDVPVRAGPGRTVRVRVVNTDNGPMEVWTTGAPYRLVAVDGRDLHGPGTVEDRSVTVTAGGRADLEVVMPGNGAGVRVQLGSSTALVLGEGDDVVASPQPRRSLDLLRYGTSAPIGFDPHRPDRRFVYSVGRRPGFLDGRPGLWWTINGHLYPDVPMFVVREGDVVRMRLENHSGDVHPMHLHGHHAVVLSRNGQKATGSPWWVDSLNVLDGESYDLAFVADNPGIWMDHCHNLPHATQGLVAHLMYEGVTEPFRVGGHASNRPE